MAAVHSDDYLPKLTGVVSYKAFSTNMHRSAIEPITEREFKTNVEYEKFMQDILIITLAESTNPKDYDKVPVAVNGEEAWLPRGVKIEIPRYMVEPLLRSQEVSSKTIDNKDQAAVEGKVIVQKNSQYVSVSVLRDPSPKGRAWLERVMREPN